MWKKVRRRYGYTRLRLTTSAPVDTCNTEPITRRHILDSPKLKDFADDNLKFDQKWQKVIQTGRKHCGKRRNCSLRAISPFPTVFSKGLFPRGVKRCHWVEMGFNQLILSTFSLHTYLTAWESRKSKTRDTTYYCIISNRL